ncbi:DUF222 domain-containing protein [Rhodococcus spelaei]|uniref:DUF222 domain-containing protein n=1 Tax=Rhodococcus spelaei TaxID=2546320 RepID=A0A541B3Y4_9NOCA|nr:HNH endonuclease signature motif containing protein [Rhodococcus spelaei]TQF67027.1 DUF222 domain-containing protein [Rhodococcus spelaei]
MELDEALTTPRRVEAWRLDEGSLLALVPELSARMRQLDALRVRLVHEIDERCISATLGASSTQAWLSGACKLTPGQAKKIITAGRSLHDRTDVADAFTAGAVDMDQVRAITNLLDQIPDLISGIAPDYVDGHYTDPVAECTQQCTDYLVAAAEHEHSADTGHRAAALKSMLAADDDGPPPDDENEQLNELFASPTAGGRVRIKGHLDKTSGEQLLTALSALSKPQPGRNNTDGEPDQDPRSAPQRRADALTDIIRHYLDSGDAPGEGGEKPHVTVFVGLHDLANATARHTSDTDCSDDGDTPNSNGSSRDNAACGGNEIGDTERFGESGNEPHGNSESPRADADEPRDPGRSFIRRGPVWMPWMGPISIRTAAILSCDAAITPIVMDDNGNPLDVGKTTRVIPRRIRRALDARDCGCAFPNCGRPAAWTDGHHICHWSRGGETKLSNLVLLCRFHHTMIHKGDWQVFIGDDGHPWFRPPKWIDPDRNPVPAHNRRQLRFIS